MYPKEEYFYFSFGQELFPSLILCHQQKQFYGQTSNIVEWLSNELVGLIKRKQSLQELSKFGAICYSIIGGSWSKF